MMQDKGLVFNIQKYSLHDGPGIRTVVFFKGCPLRCRWCSNPESQMDRIQILWDAGKCAGCGTCLKTCSQYAVSRRDSRISIDADRCKGCLLCVSGCPRRALKAEGEYKSVEEIMHVVLQDADFYEESGGGVTLSGGEVMAQPEFAVSILDACREQGIHTAIETTGYAETDTFIRVIRGADLLLCDIKHWDSKRHREGTGVGNELILNNLKTAAVSGKDVLLRLPVIPGFNDSLSDADGFVMRMRELGLNKIQILPFHQFGENKYALLGRPYYYEGVAALHPEDLEDYIQVFDDAGMEAIL